MESGQTDPYFRQTIYYLRNTAAICVSDGDGCNDAYGIEWDFRFNPIDTNSYRLNPIIVNPISMHSLPETGCTVIHLSILCVRERAGSVDCAKLY